MALAASPAPGHADEIDDVVRSAMWRRNIPGLSLAIIDNGQVVRAQGYGHIAVSNPKPVSPKTLFQAASISKPVTALAALRLVAEGKLSLDSDINTSLRSWRLPDNEFTREQKVTLRRILSHSAGLTVSGFRGYAEGERQPTLQQVLDGVAPANSQPVRVDSVPGTGWRYSGGGYTIIQQLIVDVSGQPFDAYLRDAVLSPLGMEASVFEQPLSAARRPFAAAGHFAAKHEIGGGSFTHPELAAAGLWTTPSDLARFAIGLQEMLAGRSARPILTPEQTREMLTRQKNHSSLGFAVYGAGDTQRFEHGGRNMGFDSYLTAYLGKGKGAVIMVNTNLASDRTFREVLNAIALQYNWPDYRRLGPFEPVFAFYEDFQKPVDVVAALVVLTALIALWRRFRRWRNRRPQAA